MAHGTVPELHISDEIRIYRQRCLELEELVGNISLAIMRVTDDPRDCINTVKKLLVADMQRG